MIDLPAITAAARDLADEHRRAHETYPCEFVYDDRCIRDDELRFVGSLSQQNLMRWFVLAWRDVPKLVNAVGPLVEEVERLRAVLSSPATIDRLIRSVMMCHDGSELWAHSRRDPETFRRAMRDAVVAAIAGKEQP